MQWQDVVSLFRPQASVHNNASELPIIVEGTSRLELTSAANGLDRLEFRSKPTGEFFSVHELIINISSLTSVVNLREGGFFAATKG